MKPQNQAMKDKASACLSNAITRGSEAIRSGYHSRHHSGETYLRIAELKPRLCSIFMKHVIGYVLVTQAIIPWSIHYMANILAEKREESSGITRSLASAVSPIIRNVAIWFYPAYVYLTARRYIWGAVRR